MSAEDLWPDLIEATYASTTAPERYFQLVDTWEAYLSRLSQSELNHGAHEAHFSRALDIFGQLGRQGRREVSDRDLVTALSAPAFLVTMDGTVVASNAAGDALAPHLAGQGARLDFGDEAGFRRTLADTLQSQHPQIVPILGREGHLTDFALIQPKTATLDGAPRLLVVISQLDLDDDLSCTIAARLGLTETERGVLVSLTRGLSVEDISQTNDVSVNTTRSHIRRLIEKTNARTTADLVRQTLILAHQARTVKLTADLTLGSGPYAEAPDMHRFFTRDGRQLAFRDMGAPDGAPVLLFHNMMGGTTWPASMIATARNHGLRFIAPSRPGFGISDATTATNADLVSRTAADGAALLEYLNLPRAAVVGLMSSAGLGLEFAARYPTRTTRVVTTGHAGLMDMELVNAMINPARGMAKTWFRSPIALRFIIRAAVASVDFAGPMQMLQSHLSRCEADLPLLEDAQMMDALCDGLKHAIAQGGEAFSRDGYVALNDFSDLVRVIGNAVPLTCFLGSGDTYYPPDQARRLMDDLPNYRLEILPGAGQFAFYSRFDEICTHLAARSLPAPDPAPEKIDMSH